MGDDRTCQPFNENILTLTVYMQSLGPLTYHQQSSAFDEPFQLGKLLGVGGYTANIGRPQIIDDGTT